MEFLGIRHRSQNLVNAGIGREVDIMGSNAKHTVAHGTTIHIHLVACINHTLHVACGIGWEGEDAVVVHGLRNAQLSIALIQHLQVVEVDEFVDFLREESVCGSRLASRSVAPEVDIFLQGGIALGIASKQRLSLLEVIVVNNGGFLGVIGKDVIVGHLRIQIPNAHHFSLGARVVVHFEVSLLSAAFLQLVPCGDNLFH